MNAVEAGPPRAIVGVLLAGGQARRMGGGDKCLRRLGDRTILAHVIERIAPQVDALVLNANGDPARFDAFGLPVAPDVIEGFAGPLAGVLTGMEWAHAERPDCAWIVTIATDTPFLPTDLAARMAAALERDGAELATAVSNNRTHPVFGLWPTALAPALRRAMLDEDIRKVDRFTSRYRLAEATFPIEPCDPFFNTNRPEDLEQAERLIAAAS
ncbi:MAG: molybdenum cofactor guanylyltransferase MobA [Geminicoccaceae bacterium]